MMSNRPFHLILLCSFSVTPPASAANEIGYVEQFALGDDREAALKQLIPGTEEFYYYHALHLQNQRKRAEFAALLAQWAKRNPDSGLRPQLETRQALIDYEVDPKRTLDFVTSRLGLQFGHERERPTEKPDLPTALDAKRIAPEEFLRLATANVDHLNNLTDFAVEMLVRSERKLSPAHRRHVLARAKRPDVPNLLRLIHEDLASPESAGFGEFQIHKNLLVTQLDELRKLRPDLASNESFVLTYLGKLAPGADESIENDPAARQAWLDRAWAFVSGLGAPFNSLKAHILYQRLDHDRRQGTYDAKRFLEYINLPRGMPYINPRWQKDELKWRHPADLSVDYSAVTFWPPIGSDEELVRDYLLHLLVTAESADADAPYFEDKWLKSVLAEAKIVAGVGDPERLASLLTPAAYDALKNRVDLDFDLANSTLFGPDDDITLNVWVKNVSRLIVKIFELNTAAYYESHSQPISTDIDLDGLVAGHEHTIAYENTPLRRVKRTLRFPEIAKGRGVWVVELIGNGQASRALLRKGSLRYLTRSGTAGTLLTLIDEKNQAVMGGHVIMQGRRFDADKNGEIIIPFSNEPGSRPVVLHDSAGFATLETVELLAESYVLEAGFHVERETLLVGNKSRVAVRPRLLLNGISVSAALLDKTKLTVTSTDLDGIATTSVVSPFNLADDREVTHDFNVQDRLASVKFELSGSVKSISQGKDIELHNEWSFSINEIDRTEHVSDILFGKAQEGYFLEERGKNGELRPERAVGLQLWHRDYSVPVAVSLKTDEQGRISLGTLDGIARLQATAANGLARTWAVHESKIQTASQIHGVAGDPVRVPVMGDQIFSLLEVRQGNFVRDWTAKVEIKDGFAELKELPAGDYAFHLVREGRAITLRLAKGDTVRRFAISNSRLLELSPRKPLHISSLAIEGGDLLIHVANADPFTRLHVAGTRYQPGFALFDRLGLFPAPSLLMGRPAWAVSQFVSGRDIGDELRYILERKNARHFPGVMLERPGLLLNPWAVRDTSTTTQDARGGEAFEKLAQTPGQSVAQAVDAPKESAPVPGSADPRNLDFLAHPSPVTYNGGPDKDGVVRIKLADLGNATQVHVLAVNAQSAVYRELALPAKPILTRDLRLAGGLDPKGHFAQQDEVTLLEAEKPFTIADAVATRFELYDNLGRVFTLLRTLSGNATLEEFRFIVDWPALDAAKKDELFSKYACHELSFFLSRKDPAFFAQVIQPYLRNKKDRTFLEEYLLGIDLKKYLEPWRHGQLNVVERILLAQRLAVEHANELRSIEDWLATIPPNREQDRRRFESALLGFVLDSGVTTLSAIDTVREKLGDLKDERGERLLRESDKQWNAPAAPAAEAMPESAMALNGAALGGALAGRAGGKAEALRLPLLKNRGVEAKMMKEKADELSRRSLGRNLHLFGTNDFADQRADAYAFGIVPAELESRVEAAKRSFFRKLETTKEWAENNYWHLLIGDQNAGLVPVSRFWRDYARRKDEGPFISTHVTEATRNFTEMMLALAVLDLPFPSQAQEPEAKLDGAKLTLTPKTPILLVHQAIRAAEVEQAGAKLLVSQNVYRWGDRYVEKDGEKLDKFVSGEFLSGIVYAFQVVVTNPTSSAQKLDVLFQIPQGSRPAAGAKTTTSRPLRLEPFRTETFDVAFYFPRAGTYPHFPVHVSRDGRIVASAEPVTFKVVDQLSKPDTASWAYVSQNGTEAEVIGFLEQNNLRGLDLDKIAWRLRQNADFHRRVIGLLGQRRIYHATSYVYGVLHNDAGAIREFLRHEGSLLTQAGPWLQTALVIVDPIERKSFEHLEYLPLVNARAHRLGRDRTILNDRFREQYQRLLGILACKPELDDTDRLAVTYYLLLQDRIEEALGFFAKVNRNNVATALQYDYAQAWIALAQEDTKAARLVVARHAGHPVEKWRQKFGQLAAQLDEIEGKGPQVTKPEDREQTQDSLAAKQPSFELKAEGRDIALEARNISEATVNYYLMDLEFLFSTNPFVGQDSARFAQIKPNRSEALKLESPVASKRLSLPREFQNRNVLVEVVAAGQRKSQAVYANELKVSLSGDYGQLQVRHAKDERPLSKVYVKIYADVNGQPKFYKDGYTDLRGKFDYVSLSTNDIDGVRRFSILVLSKEHGAMVREATPPQR
ncbi:MAG: hypothetical protein ACR2OZ_20275 [Verrucomicrobiales bacterium]